MRPTHCWAMSNCLCSLSPACSPVGVATPLQPDAAKYAWHQRQVGAALIEFSLIAIPLLLVGLLIMEAAQWQMVRQIAYVALLDAARAGSTQHRRPDAIEQAFTQAFLPRFAQSGNQAPAAQQHTWDRIASLSDLSPWRIEILQPDDIETISLRLTYLHEPLTPLTRALLRHSTQTSNDCVDRALAHGLLPIRVELRIEMHSLPTDWQTRVSTRNDRVVYGKRDCGQ